MMTSLTKAEWLIPTGLIALSFIPVVAGSFRLIQFGSGAEITADNALAGGVADYQHRNLLRSRRFPVLPQLPPQYNQLAPCGRVDTDGKQLSRFTNNLH